MTIKTILISRTDSIGDVVLTIPIAGYLKRKFPDIRIIFLGKTYTKDIIEASNCIDDFINYDTLINKELSASIHALKLLAIDAIIHVYPNKSIAYLAKRAEIPCRVGTSHRFFHFLTCNSLVSFSRKKSSLHESQLNFKLLKGIGINHIPELEEIKKLYGFNNIKPLPDSIIKLLNEKKRKVILHPKSKGSAREWGFENFSELINLIPEDIQIIITGTKEEAVLMPDLLNQFKSKIVDLTGKLNLEELISLINYSDALIAASTGPLHIAAACGIKAIGLYPPIRPMHPGRWKPIGDKATFLSENKFCNDCRDIPEECFCIKNIKPEDVLAELLKD